MASNPWRYLVFEMNGDGTETLVHPEVPFAGVQLETVLSGVSTFSANLPAEYGRFTEAGQPIFTPWSSVIYPEEDGIIRGGFIVTRVDEQGPQLAVTAESFTGYLAHTPYAGEASFVYADALDIVRALWKHVQSQTGSNLGLHLDGDKAGVRLGLQSPDQWPKLTEGGTSGLLPEGAHFQYTWTRTPAKKAVTTKKTDPKTKKVTVTTTPAKPAVMATYYGEATRDYQPPKGDIMCVFRDRKTGKITRDLDDGKATPAGQDVLGVITRTEPKKDDDGTTLEPFTLNWWTDSDLSSKFDALAEQGNFDYWEEHQWDSSRHAVTHNLKFAAPSAGQRRDDLRFVVGENITAYPQLQQRGDDWASEVIVLGSGEGRAMVRGTWKLSDSPRLRRVKVVTDKRITTTSAANKRAQREGRIANGLTNITQITVIDHPNAPLGSWQLGDTITVVGDGQGWAGTYSITVRILSWQIEPESGLCTLTVAQAGKATS